MDPITQLIIQGVALALVLLVIKLWFNDVGKRIDGVEATLKADIDGVEATLKADIDGVEARLKADIDGVEARLKADIKDVEARLKADIKDVKDRLQAHEDKCAERDRKVAGTIGGLVTAVTKTIPPVEG